MTWKDYIGGGLMLFLALLGLVFGIGLFASTGERLAGMAACRAICADDGAAALGGEGRTVQCACPKRGGKAELERP